MALDPNGVFNQGIVENPADFAQYAPQGLPSGIEATKDYYAQYTVYNNGRRVIQWYKRGTGTPGQKDDPVAATTSDTVPKVKADFDAAAAKGDQEGDIRPSSGPTREVYRSGKWVVEPNPVYQPPAGQNPNTPQNQNEAELQRQREANAALPKDQDPAYETNAERRTRAEARIKQQGIDAAAARGTSDRQPDPKHPGYSVVKTTKDGQSKTYYEKDDNPGVEVPPPPDQANDTPTLITRSNGKTYVQHSIPGVNGQPGQIYHTDMAGNRVTLPDEPGKTAYAPEPAGAPPSVDTVGQVTAGLRTYSEWLDGQVRLFDSSNGTQGVSRDDATKLMQRRMDLAKSAVEEQTSASGTQATARAQDITQRGQTLVDTAGRRSTAENIHNNVLRMLLPFAEHIGPGGGQVLSDAINETLKQALNYVGAAGGLRESPEVPSAGVLNQYRPPTAAAQPMTITPTTPRPVTTPAVSAPLLGPPPAVAGAGPPPAPSVPVAANPIDNTPITAPALPEATPGGGPPAPIGAPGFLPVPPPVPLPDFGASGAGASSGLSPSVPLPDFGASGAGAGSGLPPPVPLPDYGQPGMGVTPPSPTPEPAPPDASAGAPDEMLTFRHRVTHQIMQVPRSQVHGGVLSQAIWEQIPSEAAAPLQPPSTLQFPPTVQPQSDAAPQSMIQPSFMQQPRYGQSWDSEAAAADLAQRLGIDPTIMRLAHTGLYG